MTGTGPASSAATSAVPMASTATDTHTAGAIPLRRCGKKKTPAGLTTHSAKNTDFDELAHSFLVGRHPPVRMAARMPHVPSVAFGKSSKCTGLFDLGGFK